MTNPMLELADKIKYARERKLIHGTDVSLTYQEMDLAQAALRASAAQGEPVAWRWRTQRGDNWTFSIKRLSIADIGRTSSTFQEEPLALAHPAIGTPAVQGEPVAWRYEIQYGPNGEANYAWVYDENNHLVCTAQLHHAIAITQRAARQAIGTPDNARECATCHAVLADGPQPAATYDIQVAQGTPDERTELINFVSSIRQHDIDLEVRDQILKKIMAFPRAAIGTPDGAKTIRQKPSCAPHPSDEERN